MTKTNKTSRPTSYTVTCCGGYLTITANWGDTDDGLPTISAAKREARSYVSAYGRGGSQSRDARGLIGNMCVGDFTRDEPSYGLDI